MTNPSKAAIELYLQQALAYGYEGLVLRSGDKWLKVKDKQTEDVKILDLVEGKGKYVGKLGAFLTPIGKVGTGFTDAQRAEFNDQSLIGETVEVEFMEYTKEGKARHPRFIRMRYDK